MPMLSPRYQHLSRVVLIATLLSLPGCSSPEAPEKHAAESSRSAAAKRPESDSKAAAERGKKPEMDASPAADAIGVELIDGPGFETLLNKHRGRVVLVDFWATWCLSCVKQLPHTVELLTEHGDRDLSVITVSLDDPEKEDEVLRVLQANEATTENYISRFGGSDKSMELFDIEGGLPHYQLYDRQGNLHRTFSTGQENIDLEDITKAVESLLED